VPIGARDLYPWDYEESAARELFRFGMRPDAVVVGDGDAVKPFSPRGLHGLPDRTKSIARVGSMHVEIEAKQLLHLCSGLHGFVDG